MVAAAAQNTDLQRVWRLVQELSAQLSANQQETERLRRHVELYIPLASSSLSSARSNDSGNHNGAQKSTALSVDGDGVGAHEALRHAYAVLADENMSLKSDVEELSHLCAEYELGLTQAMGQIRTHQHETVTRTLTLHRNYQGHLEDQALQSDLIKQESIEVQGHLTRVSGFLRDAVREHSDVESETIIEALALENASLRARLADFEERETLAQDKANGRHEDSTGVRMA